MLLAGLIACGAPTLHEVAPDPDAGPAPVVRDGGTEAPRDGGTAPDAGEEPPRDAGTTPPRDGGTEAPRDGGVEPPRDGGVPLGLLCFSDIWDPNVGGPDYDQFAPTYASHCFGTNHQDITGIERVVFVGDSVTVGTPPTPYEEYYRGVLADRLAQHFNLEAPSDAWKRASLINGTSLVQDSGDFASCAKWGARTDDLIEDNSQLEDCLPAEERNKRTLVIMTIGGNDIASITKNGAPSGGHTLAEVTMQTQEFVAKLEDAVAWVKDPANFPNGAELVFANMFEFTDATGDVGSCPAAGVAGFDEPWADPQALEDLVVWANEEYMRIAVDHGADLIFMLEHFCGHGFHHDDPMNRCYRGPTSERWFDVSCIHPNPTGHDVIADMFMAVVDE